MCSYSVVLKINLVVLKINSVSINKILVTKFFTMKVSQNLNLAQRNSWTLDARVGRWTLDAGLWTLDSGRWTLDTGLWTLDSGRWTPDAERQTVDVKTFKFRTVQSFGNNGSISITSFLNSTLIKIFGHFRFENLSTVYSFQVTLSPPKNIKKLMMWRRKVELKWINMMFCFC